MSVGLVDALEIEQASHRSAEELSCAATHPSLHNPSLDVVGMHAERRPVVADAVGVAAGDGRTDPGRAADDAEVEG
jgi:hypothetical protein